MGDHAENKHEDNIGTGPQGTRVFKREEINQYFAENDIQPNVSAGDPSGAALIGVNGAFKDRRYEIPTGRSTIGRSSTNSIVIDSDSVSLVHARLLQKDDEWWVLNLLSTNGTFVNHRKVTDSRLHHGDRIHFGDAEFIFQNPEPQGPPGLRWLSRLGRRLRHLFSR